MQVFAVKYNPVEQAKQVDPVVAAAAPQAEYQAQPVMAFPAHDEAAIYVAAPEQ